LLMSGPRGAITGTGSQRGGPMTIRHARVFNMRDTLRNENIDPWPEPQAAPKQLATSHNSTIPPSFPNRKQRPSPHGGMSTVGKAKVTPRPAVVTVRLEFLGNHSVERVVTPPVKTCLPNRRPAKPTPGAFKSLGCVASDSWPGRTMQTLRDSSPEMCASSCGKSQPYFGIGMGGTCSCMTGLPASRSDGSATSKCGGKALQMFSRTEWPPAEVALPPSTRLPDRLVAELGTKITVFMFVSERLASIWHTCRLAEFSTRFE